MKKLTFFLLLLFSQVFAQTNKEIAREKLIAFFEEQNIQGLSISVSHKGELIWSEGFGYANLEKTKSISPSETSFRIASISKPITAVGLGLLLENKKMHLDSSVYCYVPEFPKKKYDINVYELASHRSGIRHYKWLEGENKKPLGIKEGLNKFEKSKLKFEPGTSYSYSSYGYNLLGYAMQKASGKNFESLIQETVLTPLNMTNTFADKANYSNIIVSGFFKENKNGKAKEHNNVNIYFKLPSGGYLSTSEDLVKFGSAFYKPGFLSESVYNEMFTPRLFLNGNKSKTGLSWGIYKDKKGKTYYSHTGGGIGAVSRLVVYPNEEFSIALLSNTNCDYIKFIQVMREITYLLLE